MSETEKGDVTGVILVGGKSRRMGRDKAFLEVAGKPLFQRVLELFLESFPRVVLVGGAPERFAGYQLPVLPDLYPGSPLGGIYTALSQADSEAIFVSSCDLPFPNAAVLRYLCSLKDGFDAVVPETPQGYEPLFALYKKGCLEPIRSQLESGDFCAYAWYPLANVRLVAPGELAPLDPDGTAFCNVNTPEQFAQIAAGTGGRCPAD
uniref:Probable molybdenum cofactor guanylyltransferase n=1 Tax=Geobacter sp. (strain M21) TaxID=443144 RepID=C6E2Y5_GEOSM